jgi:glycosyltransferase involved in cell wall biosynthesis
MHQKRSGKSVSQVKILHLLSYNKIRPLSLFENLVTGFDEQVFSQMICFLSGDRKQSLIEKRGYPVINLGIPKNKLKKFRPSVVFKIADIIKKHDVDIVHCQRHKPTIYGTLAAWVADKKVKVLTTVHGRNRSRTLSRKIINYVLFKRISRIISVSNAVRDDILKTNWNLSFDKVVTVYNGIDTDKFSDSISTWQEARTHLGLEIKDAFMFGTVGRLTKVKGQKVLLQAFAKVIRKYPNSWLVITGKGPLETELRRLAMELNINKRVVFLGFRMDIPDILRAYDAFILPSFSEGLPLSLLEAMATGIPVISSRVGGVPEILDSFDQKIMVTPSSVKELSAAMTWLAGLDKIERIELGKSLRSRVESCFTKEKMTSAMSTEYIAVMN